MGIRFGFGFFPSSDTSSGITGTGASPQLAVFSGASTLGSSANLTFSAGVLGVAGSVRMSNTDGTSFMQLAAQASNPSAPLTPPSSVRLFANSTGEFAWVKDNGFATILSSSASADRTVTIPNASGTIFYSTGISGGQTATGGTASGNGLTLSSTSHATKGSILFGTSAYDEVNNRLGIGVAAPAVKFQVIATTEQQRIGYDASNYVKTVVSAGGETTYATVGTTGGHTFLGNGVTYSGGSYPFTAAISATADISFRTDSVGFSGARIQAHNNDAAVVGLQFHAEKFVFTISSTGGIGIDQLPTAYLHLKTGGATANTAPLKFNTGTNNTTAEAGAMEYSGSSLFFTNDSAVRQEIPAIQQSRVTTQFNKTNSTLANITGLTANIAAGKTYRFVAVLFTTSDAAAGVKAAISGTATATAIVYEGITTNAGLSTQSRGAALNATVGAVTAVTAAVITVTGLITCANAGTLTIQFAQNATNAAASSVLVGSTFVLTQIT